MADRPADLITVALALLLVAATLLIQGLIAAGGLVAQLLDAIAGNDRQPPSGGSTLPAPLPVVITAPATPALNVHQLRQLVRHTGAARWWSLNRDACLALLAEGAAA